MNYTIDVQKSKKIRSILKNKTLSIHLNTHTYFGNFDQNVNMRFVNCEKTSWGVVSITIEMIINGSIEQVMGLPEFHKGHRTAKRRTKFIKDTLRNSIRSNKSVKDFFSVYLAHLGLHKIYIDTIKIKEELS